MFVRFIPRRDRSCRSTRPDCGASSVHANPPCPRNAEQGMSHAIVTTQLGVFTKNRSTDIYDIVSQILKNSASNITRVQKLRGEFCFSERAIADSRKEQESLRSETHPFWLAPPKRVRGRSFSQNLCEYGGGRPNKSDTLRALSLQSLVLLLPQKGAPKPFRLRHGRVTLCDHREHCSNARKPCLRNALGFSGPARSFASAVRMSTHPRFSTSARDMLGAVHGVAPVLRNSCKHQNASRFGDDEYPHSVFVQRSGLPFDAVDARWIHFLEKNLFLPATPSFARIWE